MSSLVGPTGRIYAFEPSPRLLPQLSCTIGGMVNGRLLRLALSDSEQESNLYVPEGNDNMNASLAAWTGDKAGRVKVVKCVSMPLDRVIETERLEPPNFIKKCDVEGGELNHIPRSLGDPEQNNRSSDPV